MNGTACAMLYTSKNTSNMVGPTLMAATRGLQGSHVDKGQRVATLFV